MKGLETLGDTFLERQNAPLLADLERDFAWLGVHLERRGIDIEALVQRATGFRIAIPSWGVGTGGTRFARFPGVGEPRHVFDKIEDCAAVHRLTRITPTVSLHIPWDRPENAAGLQRLAAEHGLGFDAINSNTFQDQPGQALSYKFGSLCHTDAAVRRQAIEHNLECIEIGRELGSKALTVWLADGSNFPGQMHFRRALERWVDSLRAIYAALPADWSLFLEHKLYEPALYATVNDDWGVSCWAARELGERARCLVDLGHHAPTVNIEAVVARLIHLRKLGGFHFNDSKYGDDDLDAGSIAPFRLFLVFCELVDAEIEGVLEFAPAFMLDQSHNVTDPIESLVQSAIEVQRAFVQASLVDWQALARHQQDNDAVLALATLKDAFQTDLRPILAMARHRAGGAIEPIATYRRSGYRAEKGRERGASAGGRSGIV